MLLYLCITLALFATLFISIIDCRNHSELKIKRSFLGKRSFHNFLFTCLILLFWFLTAFRAANIGNDTKAYLDYYKHIAIVGISKNLRIETGYQYFCLLLSKITRNPYFLLVICATVCYGICGIYIYKRSDNFLYSAIFLFCLVFSFFSSGIRQAIAMVIVMMAYFMIKDGKKLLPILLILLASFFHTSALIALLWFAHKYVPKKPPIVITLAIVIAVLAATKSLNSVITVIFREYESYFSSANAGTGWLGITYYALRALVFYIIIHIASRTDEKEGSLAVSNTVLLLMTVCLGFSVNLFSRGSYYFLLVTMIDIPNAFSSGKIKHRDIWMLVMGTVMLTYFMVTLIFRPEWNHLYPYKFNWS